MPEHQLRPIEFFRVDYHRGGAEGSYYTVERNADVLPHPFRTALAAVRICKELNQALYEAIKVDAQQGQRSAIGS